LDVGGIQNQIDYTLFIGNDRKNIITFYKG